VNYRIVARYLGHFSLILGMIMLPSILCALLMADWLSLVALVESLILSVLVGLALVFIGRSARDRMFQREGLALVGIGWLMAAGLSACPFVFSGVLGPVDAYFEAMSGLTTTGSTVLRDIERVPRGILFWRAFTHWIGGIGIIVLFIAVLPYMGAGGKQMFKTESPGPDPRGLRPRIRDTASALWKIYVGMTVVLAVLLMLAGMSLFDALTHTFSTLATGGFSTRNASIAAFDSVTIEFIIVVFMALAGANFGVYFAMLKGDWWAPLKNTEFKAYFLILALVSIMITVNLLGFQGSIGLDAPEPLPEYTPAEAARHATFLTVSLMTTTGFGTEDFDYWPYFSRTLLVLIMFVGGCAGSTGGGIKVVRFIILFKMAYWRVESTFRPKTVRPIRVNGQIVDERMQQTVYAFFFLNMVIVALGSLYMSLLGLPFQSAVTAVITTLNNVGPGLEHLGGIESFAIIPSHGKLFLAICMVVGRLEMFTIGVLLLPSFWRHA
jgi:trk system potassium uptake protein TrkH